VTDWAAGDLAVCDIGPRGWWDEHTDNPVAGPMNGWVGRVGGVRTDEWFDTMLVFAEWPDPRGYIARQFRKIRPDEHEACERHDRHHPS
jgi:hypothetical protein